MTIAFNTEKLAKQLSTKNAITKAYGIKAMKISLRLDEIEDTRDLVMLQKLPALNCRPLSNNPLGQWVINVTSNYAMIFLLDHDPVPANGDGSVNKELITKIRIIGFTPY